MADVDRGMWSAAAAAAAVFATPREPLQLVAAITERLVAARRLARRALSIVAVAAPGPLDIASGTILHSPNLGWKNVRIGDLLAERIATRVVVDDDARSGALGDEPAAKIVLDAEMALAHAFASIASTVDPEVIIVGGSLGIGQPRLVARSAALARRLCIAATGARLHVVQAAHGRSSVLIGAGILAAQIEADGGSADAEAQ